MTRRRAIIALVTLTVAALSATGGTIAAAPAAAETQACKQVWSSFTVSLLGDRDWA